MREESVLSKVTGRGPRVQTESCRNHIVIYHICTYRHKFQATLISLIPVDGYIMLGDGGKYTNVFYIGTLQIYTIGLHFN